MRGSLAIRTGRCPSGVLKVTVSRMCRAWMSGRRLCTGETAPALGAARWPAAATSGRTSARAITRGASGAGKYPALANNKNLETAGYPVAVILHGQKGMPWFDEYFTDVQVANVVNYIRSNFGNHYTDAVTPQAVKQQR